MEGMAGLEKFLNKVDEIESIVKGLSTSDSDHQESIQRADDFLETVDQHSDQEKPTPTENTGVNRSVINQAAFDDLGKPKEPEIPHDQQAFLSYIEKDAKERGERRKKQRKEATDLKDFGNQYFKDGNFRKAIEYYTQALGVVKDLSAIWTNRAQAYIKVGDYEKALSDCDWAIRLHENCLKAYIHRGRAYVELEKYDEALEAYKQALTIEPSKTRFIQDYISEVERRQLASSHESSARALFVSDGDRGGEGLMDLLRRVMKEGQMAMYYMGGLRLIEHTLINNTERAIFRMEGGMDMVTTHNYISKCWSASPGSVSREELDLIACMMDTYNAAVTDNEENARRLLEVADLGACLLGWAESNRKLASPVRLSIFSLLYTISTSHYGQHLILDKIDISRLLNVIFTPSRCKETLAVNSIALLNNLALHKKFKSIVRPNIAELMLPTFEALMTDVQAEHSRLLSLSLTTLTNLCTDVYIRDKVAPRRSLWKAASSLLDDHCGRAFSGGHFVDIVHAMFGLLINLTADVANRPAVQTAFNPFLRTLTIVCIYMGGSDEKDVTGKRLVIAQRAVILQGHLVTAGREAVDIADDLQVANILMIHIKRENVGMRKAGIKALAAYTQTSSSNRDWLLSQDLPALVAILKEEDEVMVGNAAFCLSHLTGKAKLAAKLTKTNIIQHLLVKARDGHHPQLQHNCAILIAKLTKADPRHLDRLRELHGVEILVDVMKHIKD